MGKALVLAEKPSVGRDLARVLNCKQKGNGYLEGNKYIVTWALGHLVTLADPHVYNAKYATWSLEDLPMLPARLKLVVIKQSGRQFNVVRTQLSRKDVTEIIIATDAGREGELVARWIMEKAGTKKPIRRLWISSVTDKAIKDGFQNLKPGQQYENLYASAVARAEADWLVGINATRALTCKFNAQLSCGRVQTPTLAIIAKREEEINSFKPRVFYGITATTGKLKLVWRNSKTKDTKTFDQAECDNILGSIQHCDVAKVVRVDKVYKKRPAPQLYDLTELQREANQKYDLSAKETLSILQWLYESHKLLTYPRTDAKYITGDMVGTLKDRITACGVGPYRAPAHKALKNAGKVNKHYVDDKKVSDHHAIIPTEQPVSLSSLSEPERKIYDLVVRRFLAVFYPPYEYEQTTIQTKIKNELFIARGKTVISQGWQTVYEYDLEDDSSQDEVEQLLPSVQTGDILKVTGIFKTQGETKPPTPFSEAGLLAAMENPVPYMDDRDKSLMKTIGETGGLGTVATRADIIEKLFNSFLIEKRGKHIFITSKGKQLLGLVPDELKSPSMTAQWEQKLGSIARGNLKKDDFMREMKKYAQKVVTEIKNSTASFKHDNVTGNRCPQCNKLMLEVNGKKGKMLICQDRDCGHRIGVAKTTNARCPNCHKRLELRGAGEGQIFVCRCGYREKLAAFHERRKKDSLQGSKKDTHRYLKQQQKEIAAPINTALADALAKLKR